MGRLYFCRRGQIIKRLLLLQSNCDFPKESDGSRIRVLARWVPGGITAYSVELFHAKPSVADCLTGRGEGPKTAHAAGPGEQWPLLWPRTNRNAWPKRGSMCLGVFSLFSRFLLTLAYLAFKGSKYKNNIAGRLESHHMYLIALLNRGCIVPCI